MADGECIKGDTSVARSGDTACKLVTKAMSYPTSAERTTAVATALAELAIRPGERVLILLPDGPGFAEAFAGTIEHHAIPLPVNPLLPAPEVAAAATTVGARLLLAWPEQIHALTDLGTEPPVLIDGAQGPWAVVVRLCAPVLTVVDRC
ncbi:MAG: AMP-binding protein [Pseudonocardiaceae bacterium]